MESIFFFPLLSWRIIKMVSKYFIVSGIILISDKMEIFYVEGDMIEYMYLFYNA